MEVTHPCVIQHPAKWFQILWKCARHKFVSCTSNWLGQMFCVQKYTRHLLRLILSPQDRQHSLSLETNPVCNAVQCFPHDNMVENRLCDECKKSALPSVCHMPEAILWLISQACWPTTRCQVVQFVPSTSIARQFVSTPLTILQLIRVPLAAWNVVQVLHFLVCQFTVSLNAFLSMSFRVVGPRFSLCVRFFPSR